MEPLPKDFAILPTIPPELVHLGLKQIFYCGDLDLLQKRKITIVGTRNPNPYAQSFTQILARKLVQKGAVVVSGGALGTDIIAHLAAMPNTIMISPSSLDIIYPRTNAKIIQQIYQKALILSPFDSPYKPHSFSFLERNKLVVSLGECVIIPQADLQSGSMQSANYALSLGKKVFVLPHQIGQSQGTQSLAQSSKAQVIWEVDALIESLGFCKDCRQDFKDIDAKDEVLEFCRTNPLFEEAFLKFGAILFEYELEGKISRHNGRIEVL
ncbi:DNA-processing protein DprA [uncultured Helicobacter sp.]|uniref:DNA-processing protein DprA n=1 Tax=uncultured Helicobacter sp. TaxID=175537 RepID=UPI002619487A|nr:DNA-processing protein DprA [uncultured Helicobacter sp.]